MDGGPGAVDGAVGDGVGLAVEFGAFGLVFELVAEEAEEGDDPLLAGFGGQSRHMGNRQIATVPIPCFPIPYLPIAYLPALHFALEDAPVVLGVGPGAGDLVLDLGGGVEAEVGGFLPGGVLDAVEDVGGEDRAFDADGGKGHG